MKRLFLFAGEQSGDTLGASLVKELGTKHALLGVGGHQMRQAGLECTLPMERFQVMGFSEVALALPRLYSLFLKVRAQILKINPDAVILIDYAEFNLLLAKSLRKKGYRGKIIQYVCPSVWAWRKGRMRTLEKHLDLLLTLLPFEQDLFCGSSLPVTYVGHPLLGQKRPQTKKREWLAIFPGSRKGEIALNLPLQLAAARGSEWPVAISVARPELKEWIGAHAPGVPLFEDRHTLMQASRAALATSGTITLELALAEIPTVVTYKIAPLNYLIGRYLFRIHLPHYCLTNIICGRTVFPEFIHRNLDIGEIQKALGDLLTHENLALRGCQEVRARLETPCKASDAIERIL